MSNRKKLPKKIRFEVFKRDKFTCQYCGRKAPDVILEIDHITPVAEGGGDELINLVTSCRDCNRGKGKTLLSDDATVEKERRALEEAEERREQVKMMIQWRKDTTAYEDEMIDALDKTVQSYSDNELSQYGRAEMRLLLKQFSFVEVGEALDIAFTHYFLRKECSVEYTLRKVGGICFNRRNGRTGYQDAE